MLILSRGSNEAVLVGDDVEVMPTELWLGDSPIYDARVRIGFRAPDDVPILRTEVAQRASSTGRTGSGKPPSREQVPGYTKEVPDVAVRLRILRPPDVTVHHSRISPIHGERQNSMGSFPATSKSPDSLPTDDADRAVELVCGKDDSILIGNVTIMIVDIRRFVRTGPHRSRGS